MSWNYRVCTKLDYYPSHMFEGKSYIVFAIYSVYYDKKGNIEVYGTVPDKYTKNFPGIHLYTESYEDLKGTHELIEEAFNKPIIDIDNFQKYMKNNCYYIQFYL